jgi:hypothetical protein
MKVGLIIPTCTRHAMQERAWWSCRHFSQRDTPVIALLNGITAGELPPIPEGVEVVQQVGRFEDECDLWQWCLDYAVAQQWDWCMVVHDDFAMREPGWEHQLELAHGWRVALATWCAYSVWDEQANPSLPSVDHLGVTLDSFSFGFRVDLFRERGCVGALRFGYGYGAWEPCIWALQQGYAIWSILLNSDHHWVPDNTRRVLGLGANGHPHFQSYATGKTEVSAATPVLPARRLDGEHIDVAGRAVRIAPKGVTMADVLVHQAVLT